MSSRRSLIAAGLIFCAVAFSTVAGGQENAKPAARIQASGTLVVHIAVQTALPDGATVSAFITAQPTDTTYEDSSQTSASSTVSGGKVRLSASLPYSWRVSSTSDQVTVSAGVSGSASVSAVQYQNSTSFSSQIALPTTGAKTNLDYSGTL